MVVAVSAFADNDEMQQLIKDANAKYSEADYTSAIELYKKVADSGFESSELYYNLGNAYFKNKNNANAILYFEKAKLLDPKDQKIAHNLKFAQQFVIDEINEVPRFFLITFFEKIVKAKKTDSWAVISLSFFIITLATLIIMFFSKTLNYKRLSLVFAILFFSISFSTFVMAAKMKNITSGENSGIIMNVVTVKSSPDEASTDLFILHEGLKVEIEDFLNNWYEIKLQDGRVGWVKTEFLGVI